MAHEPVVLVQLQLDQLRVTQFGEVASERRDLPERDLVNAAVAAVYNFVIVAFAGVGPIPDKHAAVRTLMNGDAAKPRVVGEEEILAVMGDVAGAFAFEDIVVHAIA